MFARKKQSDGFEWHKYIRTTVKLRRENRRQKVVDARHAAAQQMNAAGSALAAGSRAAGAAAWDGARAGAGAAGLAAQGAFAGAAALLAHTASRLAVAAQPLIDLLARPPVGGTLAFLGGVALGSGAGRARGLGLDHEALLTLAIAAVLLLAAVPMLMRLMGLRLPNVPVSPQAALAALLLAATAGGAYWMTHRGSVGLPSLAGLTSITESVPFIGSGKPLEGRAQAMGGDLLRIGSSTVRLAGIEAPERGQSCGNASRRWRCGAAAEAALDRLVTGRTVRCSLSGSDDGGRPLATCVAGKTEINAELVRKGHAFAASGLFGSYSSLEREARDGKLGLWNGDVTERPSEYRAKIWDEAKRRAPEGCPIKGLVTGEGRVYVLPWSPDYDRGRVQKGKGERWFCSEREAVAAGWKAPARG